VAHRRAADQEDAALSVPGTVRHCLEDITELDENSSVDQHQHQQHQQSGAAADPRRLTQPITTFV